MSLVKYFLLAFMLFVSCFAFSQQQVSGKVIDEYGTSIAYVSVVVKELGKGVATNEDGTFTFNLESGTYHLVFSHVAFVKVTKEITVANTDLLPIEITLKSPSIKEVIVEDKRTRNTTLYKIEAKTVNFIPSPSSDFNAILASQAGVSMTNELSSAYSVRGGNFDENLVYVNDIEVYRPFLVRSGQQEGLSFVNPSMVSSVLFSAGGWESKYGDKLSSVLDIQYKKPRSFSGSAMGSLLGGQVHLEGTSKNHRFTHITGVRYKSNKYILGSLDTQGDYAPAFADVQTYLTYDLNEAWEIAFLGNYSSNKYNFIPQTRETDIGNITEALRLTIFFEGQEISKFQTLMGAISTTYRPDDETELKFITSAFNTQESETFDILGQYVFNEVDRDLGSESFGDVISNRGIGTFLNHARNELDANVYSFAHKGTKKINDSHIVRWGAKWQGEIINDQLSEWNLLDSAGYAIPHSRDNIGYQNPSERPLQFVNLQDVLKTNIQLNSNRYSAYIQDSWTTTLKNQADLTVSGGLRANYWDFNNETVISPRVTTSYQPLWKRTRKDSSVIDKDIVFRFSTGLYYQPPFYKELRNLRGEINSSLKAQKSIHFVLGADYNFSAWDRPFKLVTELYYKQMSNVIPYEVDNVRIRYYANNDAKAYTTGLDMKLNGEFIAGIESWASVSVMQSREDILTDQFYRYRDASGEVLDPSQKTQATDSSLVFPGYTPRPSDQLVNFGLFFQDQMKRWPSYKVHLNLLYGSGLPFGPPTFERYKDTLRAPAYRRVDIGFSKQFIGDASRTPKKGWLKRLKEVTLNVEVFNLFQINNTVSYLWIKDVSNRLYAVPNFLTSRRVNVKLLVKF
jgi:hypothetical protein